MNKGDFIDYIAKQNSTTKVEAEKNIKVFIEGVKSALAEGKDISLVGFGRFYTSHVAARAGRNPSTGKPIEIQAYVQPKFSVGKDLKDICNGRGNNTQVKAKTKKVEEPTSKDGKKNTTKKK